MFANSAIVVFGALRVKFISGTRERHIMKLRILQEVKECNFKHYFLQL